MVVGSQQLDDTECKVQVEGYQIGEERDGVLRGRVFKCCARLNAMICSFYSAVSVPKCHRFEQALWA